VISLNKEARIFVAGHRGLVGSAILRKLKNEKYSNLVYKTSKELDLRDKNLVDQFFAKEKIEYVFFSCR